MFFCLFILGTWVLIYESAIEGFFFFFSCGTNLIGTNSMPYLYLASSNLLNLFEIKLLVFPICKF